MPVVIELSTTIKAPAAVCFNLSRSVELHKISTGSTNETVTAGRSSGLFEKNDAVTWRARHFAIYQQLEMYISAMQFPFYFEDRMRKGIFKSICHRHYFEQNEQFTTMRDVFEYEVPYGIAGWLFNAAILKKYMTKLLRSRNSAIKYYAETSNWKKLPGMLLK